MSQNRADAFKSQVPPKIREYLDAKHDVLCTEVKTDLANQNEYMLKQRKEFDIKIAEMSARIASMEDILNLQIGSRRYLMDLIEYLNEIEKKKA